MEQKQQNDAANASNGMEPEYEINLYKVCRTIYLATLFMTMSNQRLVHSTGMDIVDT